MPKDANPELMPGTLEMLILRMLARGPNHGYGIAQNIHAVSGEALVIGEGSLYPALQRILINQWAKAEWVISDTNRKVRIYTITPAGRKRLAEEVQRYGFMISAIARVMEGA